MRGTGRHSRGTGFAADCDKYNTATLLGWQVYRFTTEQVASGEAIKLVLAAYHGGEAAVRALADASQTKWQKQRQLAQRAVK